VDVAELAAGLEVFRSDGSPRPVEDAPPLRALKGETVRNEAEIVRTPRTGDLRYRQVSSSPVRDAEGAIIGSVSVVCDITERRRAEQALQVSEIMYRALFEGATVGILVADGETRQFRYANPAMCAMLGYTQDEFMRLGVADIHPPNTTKDAVDVFDEMAKGPSGVVVEIQCLRKDGSVLDVSISSATVSGDGPVYVFGFFTDITERRRDEQALRRFTDSLRIKNLAFEAAITANSIANPAGIITEVNEAFLRTWGFSSKEEAIGKPIAYFLNDPEGAAAIMTMLDASGRWEGNFIAKRKDGSTFIARGTGTVLLDEQGGLMGYQSMLQDVTEHREIEAALHESEGKYRKLHESIRDAFVSVDMAGRILEYNLAYQEMLGYPDEELRRLTYNEITPEDWHAFERRMVTDQVIERGYSDLYQKEYRRKDGTIISVELRTFLIRDDYGTPVSMWAIVRDITERLRTEQALRRSEMRYREIIELAVDGILLGSPEGKITDANSQMQKITGRRLDQLLGRHVRELFDPADLVANPLRFDLLNLVRPHVTERDLLRPDGTKLPVEMHSKRMPDGSYQSIYRDITERRRAEDALRRSEAMLKATQHMSKVGGWEWDIERQTMSWTEETYRIHDYSPGEIGTSMEEHVAKSLGCCDEEARPMIHAAFQRCLEHGEPYDFEYPFTSATGRRMWVRTTGQAVWDGDRIVKVVGNIADITVQK
ncbi:MAG: PAS domain S-box protein, partial [Verrucomicrobiota bacterium]